MGNTPPHCAERTQWLFKEIWASLSLSNNTYTYNFPEGGHSFRIYWANSDYAISVGVVPDINPNPNPDYWVYETALWSVEHNTVTYNDDFNYDDVIRFGTPEEVIAEIDRVFNLTQPASMV